MEDAWRLSGGLRPGRGCRFDLASGWFCIHQGQASNTKIPRQAPVLPAEGVLKAATAHARYTKIPLTNRFSYLRKLFSARRITRRKEDPQKFLWVTPDRGGQPLTRPSDRSTPTQP